MISKIISGGQTGADRAALDVALKFNIPHGGWIPKGRKTEDGTLPDKYHLQEMPTASYPARTEKNVLDSNGLFLYSSMTSSNGIEGSFTGVMDTVCLALRSAERGKAASTSSA